MAELSAMTARYEPQPGAGVSKTTEPSLRLDLLLPARATINAGNQDDQRI
jgi:hypothetical protein